MSKKGITTKTAKAEDNFLKKVEEGEKARDIEEEGKRIGDGNTLEIEPPSLKDIEEMYLKQAREKQRRRGR